MAVSLTFETLPKNESLAEDFNVFKCNEYSLPSFAIKFLKEEAPSYEAREDDIYIASYPKTGTTWTQEIIYLIHSDLDFEGAKTKGLDERFPYVEHARTDICYVKEMKSPRLLKTHLPYSLLPTDIHKKQCKIIYITRNPRDVVVSYYHFACMLKETHYTGTFEQFFERFISSRATYSPFLMHNIEFWNKRNEKNILFLFYEDLKKDLHTNVMKIASFLEKQLTTENINAIIEHCSFQNMAKSNTVALSSNDVVGGSVGKFFRKGQVGDWKNYLTPEQIERLDEEVVKVCGKSGLEYTYEL
ncbi:sulfotransferase 1 family member D1-like [Uloborus diversus]|uniref:sulfotransferase 1 family member D1-like n=1 Tax=Uloborus diversus TaxID=327109 RepID=UPI00240A7CD1|nr:sulfotransferase 1 family member D1-like [Uloborus diversus]